MIVKFMSMVSGLIILKYSNEKRALTTFPVWERRGRSRGATEIHRAKVLVT